MKLKIKFPPIRRNYQKKILRINPNLYWKILICLFFVLIPAAFIFAYRLYRQVSEENNVLLQNDSEKLEKQKKEEINKILEHFAEKEKKSNNILNTPASIIDPSL
jgi:predicted negative regulator of RcsB-dependent stress response